MLDLNIDFLTYRGASNIEGKAVGSNTHLNGVATDIAYFATDKRTTTVLLQHKELDLKLNVDFINALIDYGYRKKEDFYTEKFIPYGKTQERWLVDGMRECKSPRHNNHLHIGGFDFNTIIIKKDE